MLPLMADPAVGRQGLLSHLNQDPLLVLRGVITESLYPLVKQRRLSGASVEKAANVLVLALYGIAILKEAAFQNEMVREASVAAMVDAFGMGLQIGPTTPSIQGRSGTGEV
jgi:hypothetical protein